MLNGMRFTGQKETIHDPFLTLDITKSMVEDYAMENVGR
jgi:hypothetical protein